MRCPQAKNKGISHPFSYSFACPRQGIKNATGLCYPWRCPGRWPVCIQLYGHGAETPIDGCCTHISAFRGLSACQGSLNSSKIVVNEVVLTCLKCPWIQCFQGIIRFKNDAWHNTQHQVCLYLFFRFFVFCFVKVLFFVGIGLSGN